jgi:hypothetical protein
VEIAFVLELHNGGHRARVRHPVAAEVTGVTRYDATQALEAVLKAAGVPQPFTLLPLELTPDRPWIATAGSVPDDTLTDQWLDAIAEYRRQCDAADQASLPPAPNPHPAP